MDVTSDKEKMAIKKNLHYLRFLVSGRMFYHNDLLPIC